MCGIMACLRFSPTAGKFDIQLPPFAAGRYVLAPAAQLRAARSLFVILNTTRDPVGVGFFTGPDLAVTADHVLGDEDVPRSNSLSPRCLVDVLLYDPSGQHTSAGRLELVLRNPELDVAVLATLCEDGGAFCIMSVHNCSKQSQMTLAPDIPDPGCQGEKIFWTLMSARGGL